MRVESPYGRHEGDVGCDRFCLSGPEHVLTSGEPTEEELEILRNEVDPMKYIIGREAV